MPSTRGSCDYKNWLFSRARTCWISKPTDSAALDLHKIQLCKAQTIWRAYQYLIFWIERTTNERQAGQTNIAVNEILFVNKEYRIWFIVLPAFGNVWQTSFVNCENLWKIIKDSLVVLLQKIQNHSILHTYLSQSLSKSWEILFFFKKIRFYEVR